MAAFFKKTAQFHPTQSLQITPSIGIGTLDIDFGVCRLRVAAREVRLSRIEFGVLAYLALHIGTPVSTAGLLGAVWKCQYETGGTINQVKSCIKRLREKIELDPAQPHYILTVYRVGYMIAADSNDHIV